MNIINDQSEDVFLNNHLGLYNFVSIEPRLVNKF